MARICTFDDRCGQRHIFTLLDWPGAAAELPTRAGCYVIAARCPASGAFTALWIGRARNLRDRVLDDACADSDFRMRLKIASPGRAPTPTHLLLAASDEAPIVAIYARLLSPVQGALDGDAQGYEQVLRFLFPTLCETPPTHRRLVEEMRRLHGASMRFRIETDGTMTRAAPRAASRAA